jgi:hypothetical protein
MCEEYVTFKTAKLLKEKGFNEICEMFYCKPQEGYLKNRKRDAWWNSDLRKDMTCTCPTLQMTLQWLRKKYNLMCVCLPYATTEGIFYAYKIFYLDHKQLGYFTKKEKSGFDYPKSAYEDAIIYCLEHLIDIPEEKKENKSFSILTNTKTGKIFRLKSVKADKGVFTGKLHIDPSVIIVAENIKDSIPVIGRKIISDLPYVVKKKDVIGDNEKLHVAVFDSNEIMQYDFYIYNAWIQDVNEETNTIVLNCDHIS